MVVQQLEFAWGPFSEALQRQEQDLDRWLWQAAERHASAIGNITRPNPMEAVHQAMLVELLKDLRRLEARIARLEAAEPARAPDAPGT
jgi:hypothetical protein